MDIKIEFEEGDILEGLDNVFNKVEAALRVYADSAAKKIEASAKMNRPWTDRTGEARRTITAFAKHASNSQKIRITLQDGVYYGKYLEYCNGGKYAIIEPTVDKEAPNIVEGLKGLL